MSGKAKPMKNILIIDDDLHIGNVLEETLQRPANKSQVEISDF